jgi:hypothetical protein
MKKLFLTSSLALAMAGSVFAQAPAPAQTKPEASPRPPMKTHKVEAEVVKPDLENKTLTYKQGGTEKTAPVGVLAVYRLKRIKAGDKVTLTCREGAAPADCKEITFIRPDSLPPPSSTPQ